MDCRVEIQPTALHELENIILYLSSFGKITASSFLDEWETTLDSLRTKLAPDPALNSYTKLSPN